MKPIGDKILVRPAVKPEETPGGVVVPEQFREHKNEGIVLAVGSGFRVYDEEGRCSIHPITDIKPGDRILMQKRAGNFVKVGDDYRLLVAYELCLAVLQPGAHIVCETCEGKGWT